MTTEIEYLSLENDVLRAQFDRTNGAMVRLVNKATGWELLRRPELGLSFQMELPLPERHLNYIYGTRQTLTEYTFSANSLTFCWDKLTSEYGGTHDIKFVMTVTLGADGLTFTGELENRSELTASVVCFPCLGDIAPSAPAEKLERISLAYCSMRKTPLYPKIANNHGYYGYDYLGNNEAYTTEAQYILLAQVAQGFYIGAHDHTMREMVNYSFRFRPGYADSNTELLPTDDKIDGHTVALELFIAHFTYVNPDESYTLVPIVIQPYQGSWHKGVDKYRSWRTSWFTRPPTPAWVTAPHAWQQVQLNCAEDSLRYNYAELIEIGKECAAHGVEAIQVVGWNDGGQDRGNPSHDTDPRLGSWAKLQEAIATVQALGVKIILFSKFTWGDRSQPWYRTVGHQYATKDPYGDAHIYGGYLYQSYEQLADINTRRFSPMCHLSAEWREVAAAEFTKLLDLGAAGMLFDECQHHAPAKYCFDPTHGHHVPAFVHGGDIPLCERFLQTSQPRDAEFLYAGEACYDVENLRYHLAYYRITADTVHLLRYMDPYLPMMIAVTGFDDRNQLNKCLQHRYIISYEPFNFHGRLADFPRTLAYGKLIDALRTRYRAYLWDAEYADTVGASVTVAGQPYADYTAYHQSDGGKRALVIANTDAERTISATLAFAGGTRGPLQLVTPEAPETQPTGDTVTIPPRSVVVVME